MDLDDGGAGGASGGANGGGGASDMLLGGPTGGTGQMRSDEGAAAVADGKQPNATPTGDLGHAPTVPDAQAGAADPDWLTRLSADPLEGDKPSLRDWVKSTGVKDLDGLAKIARDNQAALRDSGRVKVPGEGASAEEVAAYHKAIGVPDEAKGYEFAAPKGEDGEALPVNATLLERIASSAKANGVPKSAMEAVVADFMAAQLDEANTLETTLKADAEKWAKAQGADRDAKLAAVDRAGSALGLDRNDLLGLRAALGSEKALNLLSRIGDGMTEDVLMGGGGKARFGVSAAEAQAEMDRLKADPAFQARVLVPGSAERQRWDRLQAATGAEADRKARENS